jgi:hypothetical protein
MKRLVMICWSAVVISGSATGVRIVDYGDDYAHYRQDQFIFSGAETNGQRRLRLVTGVDVDGDGQNDDSISYVPFSLSVPAVPYPGLGPRGDQPPDLHQPYRLPQEPLGKRDQGERRPEPGPQRRRR